MTTTEQAIDDIRRLAQPNATLGVPWAVMVITFINAIDETAVVVPGADTPPMSPTRAAHQLWTARNAPLQEYRDTCATIAALATHSNVNATARLLEILTNAAGNTKGTPN